MRISEVCRKAEQIAKKFNPDGIAPFPFEEIAKVENIKLLSPTDMPKEVSGAIIFVDDVFYIFVNKDRSEKRQYFTIAHELGHYFLHSDYLKKGEPILDLDGSTSLSGNGALYRADVLKGIDPERKQLEIEANNFAASLIMPEKLVRNAWEVTDGNIEACAEIFKVSTVAMSVRLERLRLVE